MKTTVTILETNFEVEWDFDITAHGNGGTAPSLSYPGDPPEPCEFDITILSISVPKQAADVTLELPTWLSDLIANHLHERDDINAIVQEADRDFLVLAARSFHVLRQALEDLLEQIDLLEGIEHSRDVEPYKAEACWEDAVSRAQDALARAKGKP